MDYATLSSLPNLLNATRRHLCIPGSGYGSIYGSGTVLSKFYGSSVLNGSEFIY